MSPPDDNFQKNGAHAAHVSDLIEPKGRFVGSIENQMLPIGDQLEGKVVWT